MSSSADKLEPWYAVRSLFFDKDNDHYEERTILVHASSQDEALEMAEQDARQYCEDVGGLEYQGYSDSFHIFGKGIDSGTEIFSLMRATRMPKGEYIERFLSSGMELRSGRE